MSYIGAKTKRENYLITLKLYGPSEEIKKVEAKSLSDTLDSIVNQVHLQHTNVVDMTEYVLDDFEATIFYDVITWVEVETLHADGTFYGDVRVHDEALV